MRVVSRSSSKSLLALAAIALAITCGLALGRWAPTEPQPAALEWLDTPRPVATFNLASSLGEFNAQSLRGHWQLIALGFTHCPDLCPTTLSELAALRSALPDTPLRVIFVSVDPARDTAERLADFVGYFGDGMIGVTGSDEQLRLLAHSLGMDYRREGNANAPVVSHSPAIALIGPDGRIRGRLRPGFDTQQTARDIAARMREAS